MLNISRNIGSVVAKKWGLLSDYRLPLQKGSGHKITGLGSFCEFCQKSMGIRLKCSDGKTGWGDNAPAEHQ